MAQYQTTSSGQTFNYPSSTDQVNALANLQRAEKLIYDMNESNTTNQAALSIQSNVNNLLTNNNYTPGTISNVIDLEAAVIQEKLDLEFYETNRNLFDALINTIPQYLIEGVNTDGSISVTSGLTGNWLKIGNIIPSIGKPILSVYSSTPLVQHICTTDFNYYALEIQLSNIPKITNLTPGGNGAHFLKIGMAPDNSLIGLGTNNKLYFNTSASQKSAWQGPLQTNIKIIDFAVCPDNTVYLVGSDNQMYTLPNYKSLNGPATAISPPVRNITSISIAPDGKLFAVMSGGSTGAGTISYLESWDNTSGEWLSLGTSCCFKSITTISTLPEIMYMKYLFDSKGDPGMLQNVTNIKNFITNNVSYFNTMAGQIGNAVNSNDQLDQTYNSLKGTQKQIGKTLLEYQQVDHDEEENTKYLNSKSMLFRIMFVIILILLIFTVKEMSGAQNLFNDPLSYFFFACVLLASIGLFKGTLGFFLFGLMCLGLVLVLTNMNR
jgi:hypothetical protein